MSEQLAQDSRAGRPATIWQALDAWANALAPWQQFIIRSSIAHGQLTSAQIEHAYQLFLIGKRLSDSPDIKTLLGTPAQSRPAEVLAEPVTLTALDELEGINALPTGAKLTFGPSLTVIYGRNGAGKSGFTRVFSNACFSRQQSVILPDIHSVGHRRPKAKFHFSIGATPQPALVFGEDHGVEVLKRFTVFDSAVARHHITQTAAFEFRPAGFDVFPEVARVYGILCQKLDHQIAAKTRPNDFPAAFLGGGTEVHAAVSKLSGSTDLAVLRGLATYGSAEKSRLAELDAQILALRSQSPKAVLASLREAKLDLAVLLEALEPLRSEFAAPAVSRRVGLITTARSAAASATLAGSDQFKRPFLSAVGSPEWDRFVGGVHGLAHRERAGYPAEGDPCLLCERPLDGQSTAHVAALLAFAEGEAVKAAAEAQKTISNERERLARLDLQLFTEATRVRSHVERLSPDREKVLTAAFARLAEARTTSLGNLSTLTTTDVPVDVDDAVAALATLTELIDRDIERLSADDTEAALSSIQLEYKVLRHRHVLSQQLPVIDAFVKDQAWVFRAQPARNALATRPVTDKEKELFAEIVGRDYRERFAKECERLNCVVPIELHTVGRSGQTLRSMAVKGGHKPEAILSEGEQRAVALADFLTEVTLNPASAGIVLDDPVTSQDHERRHRIAERLVAESKLRQVVIFTHDLVFLNALFEDAALEGVPIQSHWIERDSQGQPGQVALGDAPATIRIHDTTERAELALSEAEAAVGSVREVAIRRGMGALRRTLEETVVRKLLKDAVPRWSDQVRVTTLRKVNWDNAKVEEIAALYEDLSRYIDGHSHTDEASGSPPEPKELELRIERVKALIKWAKVDRPK